MLRAGVGLGGSCSRAGLAVDQSGEFAGGHSDRSADPDDAQLAALLEVVQMLSRDVQTFGGLSEGVCPDSLVLIHGVEFTIVDVGIAWMAEVFLAVSTGFAGEKPQVSGLAGAVRRSEIPCDRAGCPQPLSTVGIG
jgi:hypothetical protein